MEIPDFIFRSSTALPSPEGLQEEGADVEALQKLAIQRFVVACLELFPADDPGATLSGKLVHRERSGTNLPTYCLSLLQLQSGENRVDWSGLAGHAAFLPGRYDHLDNFQFYPTMFMATLFSDPGGPRTRDALRADAERAYDLLFGGGEFDLWQRQYLAWAEKNHLATLPAGLTPPRPGLRL
jgi:hypothetical protein